MTPAPAMQGAQATPTLPEHPLAALHCGLFIRHLFVGRPRQGRNSRRPAGPPAGRHGGGGGARACVSVWSRPNGLPMAYTRWPTMRLALLPTATGLSSASFSGGACSSSTATSLSGSPPMTWRPRGSGCWRVGRRGARAERRAHARAPPGAGGARRGGRGCCSSCADPARLAAGHMPAPRLRHVGIHWQTSDAARSACRPPSAPAGGVRSARAAPGRGRRTSR